MVDLVGEVEDEGEWEEEEEEEEKWSLASDCNWRRRSCGGRNFVGVW